MVGIVQGHDNSIKNTNHRNVLTPSQVSNSRSIRFTVASNIFINSVGSDMGLHSPSISKAYFLVDSAFTQVFFNCPPYTWILSKNVICRLWGTEFRTSVCGLQNYLIVDFSPSRWSPNPKLDFTYYSLFREGIKKMSSLSQCCRLDHL